MVGVVLGVRLRLSKRTLAAAKHRSGSLAFDVVNSCFPALQLPFF
jgi:hypothetical protein